MSTWTGITYMYGSRGRLARHCNPTGTSRGHQTVSGANDPEIVGVRLGNLCIFPSLRAACIRENGIAFKIEERQPAEGFRRGVVTGT